MHMQGMKKSKHEDTTHSGDVCSVHLHMTKFRKFGSSEWPWVRNTFKNVLALSCLNWLYSLHILLCVNWNFNHHGSRVERLSEKISVFDRAPV